MYVLYNIFACQFLTQTHMNMYMYTICKIIMYAQVKIFLNINLIFVFIRSCTLVPFLILILFN